ncbi:MAG: hypothetical protein KAH57_08065 [Thermoplasmata archaeon]|nr:hypothetical protein [Thermoplasmata archaeon]
MDLILDASALLSGKFTSMPPGNQRVLITSLVRDEIGKGAPKKLLERLIDAGLKVLDPVDLKPAEDAATSTGDLPSLSKPDISVIALAIETDDPMVLTDDFRVQNVLKKLKIPFEPAGEIGDRAIKEVWTWSFRCRGCGRYFDDGDKLPDCPICGSELKRSRKKPRSVE